MHLSPRDRLALRRLIGAYPRFVRSDRFLKRGNVRMGPGDRSRRRVGEWLPEWTGGIVVHRLRRMGIAIETAIGRGYRLVDVAAAKRALGDEG
jgi:hypothetical protein